MKTQILKTITIFWLLYSSNILADTLAPTPEEYKEIVDSFKLVDTSKKELFQTFRVNGEKIKLEIQKKDYNRQQQLIEHIIAIEDEELGEQKVWIGTYRLDQKPLFVLCVTPDKKIVLASVVRSSNYNKQKKQKLVQFSGLASVVDNDSDIGNYSLDYYEIFEKPIAGFVSITKPYNPNDFYPYFNEQRILARLYETETCNKEATQKANIEVLVGDKWIPQEQSWNTKEEKVANTNQSSTNLSLTLNQLFENAKTNQKLTIENINEVLKSEELNTKTLQKYNDIAYYLQQSGANAEAIFLLEKILEKFPNRTVAYLNLADAYNGKNENQKTKQNYEKYINLMKQDGKESKIPQRVLEFK